ncbi:MAG: peptidase C39 family protein [Candidatus Marsarchaeota archaeon]|jgi:hypothetical protein|nr:peptidase C39 family protein [Candidatus Marsarchaeota archaeon]
MTKPTRAKIKKTKMFDIPSYPQSEEFTSSAACAMMVLKFLNKNFKTKKETEFEIWQEAVNGSVWHGSKYGIAYALAKRGAKIEIVSSNMKDEGYEKKLAVYDGVNLDTLKASFSEIKNKVKEMGIKESYGNATVNTIKKYLNDGRIPVVLVNANVINPYIDASPHWIVVKGYDNDTFYMNDPYSDSTLTMESDIFKAALGYESESHVINVRVKK